MTGTAHIRENAISVKIATQKGAAAVTHGLLNKDWRCGMAENAVKSILRILQEVSEDICDNYCKYRDNTDEECLCEIVRSGKDCPLDRLN